MPEGDTVHLVARRLHRGLAGSRLVDADLRVPALAGTDLAGRAVLDVGARGKHLLLRIEGGTTLHSHLGMDGSWHLYPRGHAWRGPGHEVRAVLTTAHLVAVGWRLPVLELVSTDAEEAMLAHLGPDLLGPDWDAAEAVRRLSADGERAIGEALIDQRNLAGLGNVYKSEVCFLAGVDPEAPVAEVDLVRIVALAKRLIEANRGTGGQVTTGDTRRGRDRWVYGRRGRPCRRCGTPVLRSPPGDVTERVTYRCPACQPRRATPRDQDPGGG